MDPIAFSTVDRLHDGMITIDDVVSIVRGDLPLMSEADLAAILCTIMNDGPHPVARVVEPIVRAELARRRSAIALRPYRVAA